MSNDRLDIQSFAIVVIFSNYCNPKQMRKAVSIVLIGLLLLNMAGFYGVFMGLRYKNTQDLLQRFDTDDYSLRETVTLKVPLSIPYATNDQAYERVDGEIQHEGEVYRLVKQRLYNDTLYIVCFKDNQGKRINKALADYVKSFSDAPVNAKTPAGKILQTFSKDYLTTSIVIEPGTAGWEKPLTFVGLFHSYHHHYFARINHPPEA